MMGNIIINKVSYTEEVAMKLGIHPDKKKKKRVINKEPLAGKTDKDIVKK